MIDRPDGCGLNEDWRAGDLAECVADDWLDQAVAENPRKGDVVRVTSILEAEDQLGRPCFCLTLEGKPGDLAWNCTGFRKLQPVITSCSDGWADWLKARVDPKVLA